MNTAVENEISSKLVSTASKHFEKDDTDAERTDVELFCIGIGVMIYEINSLVALTVEPEVLDVISAANQKVQESLAGLEINLDKFYEICGKTYAIGQEIIRKISAEDESGTYVFNVSGEEGTLWRDLETFARLIHEIGELYHDFERKVIKPIEAVSYISQIAELRSVCSSSEYCPGGNSGCENTCKNAEYYLQEHAEAIIIIEKVNELFVMIGAAGAIDKEEIKKNILLIYYYIMHICKDPLSRLANSLKMEREDPQYTRKIEKLRFILARVIRLLYGMAAIAGEQKIKNCN